MGNDFDFLSTMGADWPAPVISVEPPALPVLEDPLACLQPSSHAADDLIRGLWVDDLLQRVLGTDQAELAQLAAHEELLKNQAAVDAQFQRVQEIGELVDMGLSKSMAEFAASTPPTRPPVIPTRPPVIPNRPTPLHPVRTPRTPSRHRRAIDKMVAKACAAIGCTEDEGTALADSMESFVNNAVRKCA